MTVIALIILWGFFALAFYVLNIGSADQEAKRREEYWKKFEK